MAMPAWISEIGVAASVSIAVVAIWGEKIRGLLQPRLGLSLVTPNGHLETLAEIEAHTQKISSVSDARYYHVRVTNSTAYPEAREVEVLLIRLEIRGPDGGPQPIYEEVLPLSWKHQAHYPPLRTIGRTTIADADLFYVKPGSLHLTPKIKPLNFADAMAGEQHLWITVEARGLNGASKPLRFKIDWDGIWAPGDEEMAKHLIIKPDAI